MHYTEINHRLLCFKTSTNLSYEVISCNTTCGNHLNKTLSIQLHRGSAPTQSPTETARLPHAISKYHKTLLCCLCTVCLKSHFVIIYVALHLWNKELRTNVHAPCAVYIYVMQYFYYICIIIIVFLFLSSHF